MEAAVALILFASILAAQSDKRLVFSTYQGGDRNDDAQSVAVDASGNIYVTGETESRDLQSTTVGGKPLTAAVFAYRPTLEIPVVLTVVEPPPGPVVEE